MSTAHTQRERDKKKPQKTNKFTNIANKQKKT